MNPVSLGVNGLSFLSGALDGLNQKANQMVASFGSGMGSSNPSIASSEALSNAQFERQMQMNMHFQEISTRSNIEKSRHEAQMSVINNLRVR